VSRGRRQLQPTSFFIRRAVDSILATPVISSVTITSIAVSVLLAGTVLLVGSNVYRVVAGAAASGVDVSVYLANGVSEARVVELKKSFAATEGVGRVQYVSKDEAWQFLAANLVGSAELLDGLDAEVLPASFELALEQGISGPGLDSLLESWSAMPEIEDVQYNRQLGQRLRGTMGLVRWVAWALGALALVASTIIVGATFQLAVFTRREEMEVLIAAGRPARRAAGFGRGRGHAGAGVPPDRRAAGGRAAAARRCDCFSHAAAICDAGGLGSRPWCGR
jgi:cell division transport system permease protein